MTSVKNRQRMGQFLSAAVLCATVPAVQAQTAVAQDGEKAVDKPLLVVLTPPQASPAYAVTKPFRDGILASYREDKDNYTIRQVEVKPEEGVAKVLEQVADEGAMLVIGPILKNNVDEIAQMPFVPLPVLAINRTSAEVLPELFINMDMSAESQMSQLVSEAVAKTKRSAEANLPFLILTTSNPYDQRLADAAEAALDKEEIPSVRMSLAPSDLREMVRSEEQEFRATVFAMNSTYAGMVRPFLAPYTPVYGTSYTDPKNNEDAMSAHTQSNDLRGMVTLEIPAITELDSTTYSKYRSRLLKMTAEERLMFSVGVDAWRLGKEWLEWHEKVDYADGMSGRIHFDKSEGPHVARSLTPVVVTTKVQTRDQDEPDFVESSQEAGL